jgi:hypothetical protein
VYPNLPQWLAETATSERGLVGLIVMVGAVVGLLAVVRFQRVGMWARVREWAFYGALLAVALVMLWEVL